ncbi:MAG: DNA polymerase I [Gemmatimonadota bacterium]
MTAPEAGTERPTLFLVDGYALIYRAFFAMISRPLTTSSGENTSAPFGLARFLTALLWEQQPDYVGVVFDAGDSGREAIYPDYKATREKMPDELRASLNRCREIIEAMRIPVLEVEGWEADDIIGTLSEQASEAGLRTVIVSGDKDFYQLIDENTWLLNPGRRGPAAVDPEWVTPANAAERLGVPPEHVTDFLALLGDSSDNVPGVRGIGQKTAPGLIEQFGSIESLLERVDEVESGRARKALEAEADLARLSKKLVTIRKDAPVELDLDLLRTEAPDKQRLKNVFLDLEFRTLAREVDRIPAAGNAAEQAEVPVRLIEDLEQLDALTGELRTAERFAIDIVAARSEHIRPHIVGFAIATRPNEAYYLPIGHRAPSAAVDSDGNPELALTPERSTNLPLLGQESPQTASGTEFLDVLSDPGVAKIGHDTKALLHAFGSAGLGLGGVEFDTEIASYCLDPGRRDHELESLAHDKLGAELPPLSALTGSGRKARPLAECSSADVARWAAARVDMILRLREPLHEELKDHETLSLMHGIEMPLIAVLVRMERTGILLDKEVFSSLAERMSRELAQIQAEIYKLAGGEINIRSVPQLRELLFEKLALPVVRNTKTGPSTDESVLSQLAAGGHDVPRLILEHRELDKLNSTYVIKLPEMVDSETGRIHTRLNQTVTATGRLSSSDPNLQNIPIRSALGREIRRGFVAPPGRVLLSADYSQVELRVMAHLSGDASFVEAFRAERDIHRETAALIFGVPSEAVTGDMRAQAKTINFATLYGQGPVALAGQLGISRQAAADFIQTYFERFEGVSAYLDSMKEMARERGYVETMLGRRRYIPEIRSQNPGIRGFGERTAANSPIQGTAADLIKLAMISIDDRLSGSETCLLLQVHDELLLEVPEAELGAVSSWVRQEMEEAIVLDVPLRVDMGSGRTWYDCKNG